MVALAMAGSSSSSTVPRSRFVTDASKSDGEGRTRDGRDVEQLARRRRQPVDAPADNRSHTLGAVEGVQGRAGAPAPAFPHERAGLDEVAPQFPEQEWVAVGLLREHLDRTGGDRFQLTAGRGLDELGDTIAVEARDLHARDALEPVELAQRVVERVADVGSGLAVRREQTHPERRRRPEPVQDQLQGRPARPLEVVEHEQHRRAPARVDDEIGDGLEVRGAGIARDRHVVRVELVLAVGLQQGAGSLGVGVDDAEIVGVGQEVLQRVRHGSVRRATAFAARAEEHGRALRGDVPRELRREPGLARAGFTAHQHGLAAAVLDRIPRARELFPLLRPRDERDRRHRAQRRGQQAAAASRIDRRRPLHLERRNGFGEALQRERLHRAGRGPVARQPRRRRGREDLARARPRRTAATPRPRASRTRRRPRPSPRPQRSRRARRTPDRGRRGPCRLPAGSRCRPRTRPTASRRSPWRRRRAT